MNTVQNILLQQMALMAGGVSLPQVSSEGGSGSFQEMMKQAKPEETGKTESSAQKTEDPKAPVQQDEEDMTDANRLQAAYDALQMTAVFQQNIQPVEEAPEAVAELPEVVAEETAAPVVVQTEAVQEAAVLPEQQQAESTPAKAETAETVAPKTELEAEQAEQETAPVETVKAEARSERPEDDREDSREFTKTEVHVEQKPLFREVESAPVKVGETYEVDTTAADMEVKLAKTIQTAVQTGSERIEIKLNPDSLGALTVEMTRTGEGVLQVVLHASSGKAANLLSDHLSNLTTALQGMGQNEVRVEVRQEPPSSQQHPFQQADPDGRGQHHGRQEQHQRQDQQDGGEDFLQQLRLGLVGS